jgi:hypothetical protein
VDIHKPKPIHSWRELIVEIGVIVVGIVIALSGEQIVEALHWSHQIDTGEAALKINFVRVVDNAAELDAQQTCVQDRLTSLGALVDQASASGRLPPVGPIGNPPFSPWRNTVWDGLVAGQTVTHLPHDKLMAYSTIAVQSGFLADLSDQQLDQWNTLSTVTGPGRRFSDVEAETLRVTLSKARFSAEKMRRTSQIALERIRATGLLDPADFAAATKRAADLRKTAAICAPMSTPKAP